MFYVHLQRHKVQEEIERIGKKKTARNTIYYIFLLIYSTILLHLFLRGNDIPLFLIRPNSFLICWFLFMRGIGLHYFSLGYRNTSTKSINRYRNSFFRRFSFSNKNSRKTSRPATYLLNRTAPKTHDRFTRSDDIKRPEIIRSILSTYKREIKREEFRRRKEKKFQRNDWRPRFRDFPANPPILH